MDKDRFFELALSFSRVKNLSSLEFVYGFQRPDKSLFYFIIRKSKLFVFSDLSGINVYDRLRSDFIYLNGFAQSELLHSYEALVVEVIPRKKAFAHEVQDFVNYCMSHRVSYHNLSLVPVGSKIEPFSGKLGLQLDELRLLCEALEAFFFIYERSLKVKPLEVVGYSQIQNRSISACLLDDNRNRISTVLSLDNFPLPTIKSCKISKRATISFFKKQVKRGRWVLDIITIPTPIAAITQSSVSSEIFPMALLLVDESTSGVISFYQFVSESQLLKLLISCFYESGLPEVVICNTARSFKMLGAALKQLTVKVVFENKEDILSPLKRLVWNGLAYNNKHLKRYTYQEESLEEDFLNDLMLEDVSRNPKNRDELIKNIGREDFSIDQYRHRFDFKLKKRRARRFLGDVSKKAALSLFEKIKQGGFSLDLIQGFNGAMSEPYYQQTLNSGSAEV